MPAKSTEVIKQLEQRGFKLVKSGRSAGTHKKLKDNKQNTIIVPYRNAKDDVKTGLLWNIDRKLKALGYEPLQW